MRQTWFHRWIFESYHPTKEGLALFRIFASLMFLFFLMPDASFYTDLAEFPDDFFSPPPGPMMLLDSFPPAWFFYTIHALLVGSWICVLVGYRTRIASLAAGLFMMILLGFIFSIGKINHQMLLILLPMVMAFSGWGSTYSIDSGREQILDKANGWPLTLLALFIGFMMFTAGFPKILGGWLGADTLATKGHLLNQYFVRGRTELLSGFMVELDAPWMWGMLDWATVIFETGFLIAAFRAGWTRLFVCFAVFFHFSTMLTLNIGFLVNFPAYAAFLPWSAIHDRFKRRLATPESSIIGSLKSSERKVPLYFAGVLSILFSAVLIADKTALLMPLKEPSFNDLVLIGSAVLIVVYFAVCKAISLLK